MQKPTILNWFILLTSSLNYAGAILLNIVWKLDLLIYLPLIFIVSCLTGIVLVDFEKSLVYACVSLFLSTVIVTAIMTVPPLIIGEGPKVINEALMSALNAVSRILLFNLVACIVGALLGSMIGELVEPFEEIEI